MSTVAAKRQRKHRTSDAESAAGPKVPKVDLSKIDWKKFGEEVAADRRRQAQDDLERRTLSGQYEPEKGQCKVCGGCVRSIVKIAYSEVIGAPPMSGFVSHWACSDCGLMYERCPERTLSLQGRTKR